MKVAPKLVLAAWFAFLPMLALHAWLSVRREQALFRSEIEQGLSLLGEHLRQVMVAEWKLSGAADAGVLLAAVARTDRNVEIDWLPPRPEDAPRGLVPSPSDRMTWLEPVEVDGSEVGRIEISESLAAMRRYVRSTVLRMALLSVALGLAGVTLARALGERWIGRRLEQLVAFARRTGAGSLGDRIDLGGRDEISALATSMADMSAVLAEAHEQARAAHAERLAMLQELRHADRLAGIGRLASSVAHELGTPLNVAMGHATRIVKAETVPAEVKRSAEVIHRQMDRMASTIQNILGFARRSPAPLAPLDLRRIAESVRDLLAPLVEERRVRLELSLPAEPARVLGSQTPLEQALSNLIANAVDVTGVGGRVEVVIERGTATRAFGGGTRPGIEVRVRDHGPGVPEADLARLFQPFFTSKPQGAGTGLGLWITQGIVQDHGGSIHVANHPQGGACFTLRFPEIDAR